MSKQIMIAGFSAELAAVATSEIAGSEQEHNVIVVPSLVSATASLALQPQDALILGVSSKNVGEALTWLSGFAPANDMYVMVVLRRQRAG